jgi:SAM-dependent methyltransferase
MDRYGAETYGQLNADVYDAWHDDMDPTEAVDFLAELAAGGPAGPVLELAVGTGRVTLSLAERGIDVRGIDASAAMVERLRAKPGGDRIPVTIGDMADVDDGTDDAFALVFVVFTTFFFLLTQDEQVRCVANVADRLLPGGHFVLECLVPDLARYQRNQSLDTHRVDVDSVRLVAVRHSPARQRFDGQHVLLTNGDVRLAPVAMRYAWPSEIDLMARLAGLAPAGRWGGWRGQPFDGTGSHVSAYVKPSG